MSHKHRRLPSPALVISVIALIVAIGGGAVAIAALNKQKVKHIAAKEADKRITSCNGLGQVKGFARVVPDQVTNSFSSHGVDFNYNCTGRKVEARSAAGSSVEVRFKGSPAIYALANVLYRPGEQLAANISTDVEEVSGGDFRVYMRQANSGAADPRPFVIMTP
jgi:hypothetical protein